MKEQIIGKQIWDCSHTCQRSGAPEVMEGQQEARSHRQQSPLPAKFFFCLGIYSIFKRSQIWHRAAILLAAIATEWRQFAGSTHDSRRFQEGTVLTHRRAEGIPRAGDTCKPVHVQSSSASQEQQYVRQKFWDHCLCDLQPVLMRCGCAGLLSIQKLSQMSRNPRQMQKTLRICLGKIPVRKIKGTF